MKTIDKIENILKEGLKTSLDPSALKEFTTIDGKKYKLAIVTTKKFDVKDYEMYLYVTTDLKFHAKGTYSGGDTGAGVSDYGGLMKDSGYTFKKWY